MGCPCLLWAVAGRARNVVLWLVLYDWFLIIWITWMVAMSSWYGWHVISIVFFWWFIICVMYLSGVLWLVALWPQVVGAEAEDYCGDLVVDIFLTLYCCSWSWFWPEISIFWFICRKKEKEMEVMVIRTFEKVIVPMMENLIRKVVSRSPDCVVDFMCSPDFASCYCSSC